MLGVLDFPSFCLAVVVFLALPGPGTFCLIAATTSHGFKGGAAATIGVLLGDQVLLWSAALGLSSLMSNYPAAFSLLRWAGALYIAWVGLELLWRSVKALRSPAVLDAASFKQNNSLVEPKHSEATTHFVASAEILYQLCRRAFLITVLNPKALLFYFAFFPLFIDPAHFLGLTTIGVMSVTIALITLAYCLSLCGLWSFLQSALGRWPVVLKCMEALIGLLLILLGFKLFLSE
jgi:leucine efflux protein